MQVYAARLPEQVISKLKEFERAQYRLPRAAVRAWIRQRLEAERSNIEPAPGADIGVTTPGTDGHQTQGADACVNID